MKVPITINDFTFEISVDDTIVHKVMAMVEKKPEKKTGYERNERGQYYHLTTGGDMQMDYETDHSLDQKRYQAGNYYTSRKVAENNARADRLMRNLRRFAAEHGGCLCPKVRNRVKEIYVIRYDGDLRAFDAHLLWPTTWGALFTSKESCEAAIEAFRDELTWYFTEYDPMPEGWWDE